VAKVPELARPATRTNPEARSPFFETNPESAYILLFTGIEALIPSAYRVETFVTAMNDLQAVLVGWDIAPNVRDDLRRNLEYKKQDSIRHRGRQFVQILDPHRFDDDTAEAYFLRGYEIRNKLVHGNVDRPSSEQVTAMLPDAPICPCTTRYRSFRHPNTLGVALSRHEQLKTAQRPNRR